MLATGKQNTEELRSYSIRACGRAKLNTVSPSISVPITNSRPHRWISRELRAFSYNTHLLIKTVQRNECRQGRPFSTALTIQVTSVTDANADSQQPWSPGLSRNMHHRALTWPAAFGDPSCTWWATCFIKWVAFSNLVASYSSPRDTFEIIFQPL